MPGGETSREAKRDRDGQPDGEGGGVSFRVPGGDSPGQAADQAGGDADRDGAQKVEGPVRSPVGQWGVGSTCRCGRLGPGGKPGAEYKGGADRASDRQSGHQSGGQPILQADREAQPQSGSEPEREASGQID